MIDCIYQIHKQNELLISFWFSIDDNMQNDDYYVKWRCTGCAKNRPYDLLPIMHQQFQIILCVLNIHI